MMRVRRCFHSIVGSIAGFLLLSASATAASLSISPIRIDVVEPGNSSNLTVANSGAAPVNVQMRRLEDSVFAGLYTVDQSFPGAATLAILGADAKGNESTRLVAFSITNIIAANRTKVALPRSAGTIELPPGAMGSNATLVTFGPGVAHVVAWPRLALIGSTSAVEDRRHWHAACWARRS